MDDLVAKALHAARQHFDEGGFLESLRGMFSGPEVLSTGEKLVDDGRVNWGNPDLPSDFFRADKAALALAKRPTVGEPGNDVTGSVPTRKPLTAPRPGIVKATELAPPPPQAFTPVSVEDLSPAPVNIPLNAPERGVPVMGASVAPASFATQPIAYSPEAPATPAQAAIGKLTARAPQDVEQPASNAQILAAIRANESRNNPKAQNPTSSAGGLYQFLNSTWGNTLRRMDPERFGAYSDRQLRALKTSPDTVDLQHAAANYHLANDIAPRLSKAGVPLTPGSAYLSWFQGPGGAVKAYTAPDDATVAQVFPRTVSANASMRFNGKPYAQWTMSDLRQWADTAMAKRMGRAEGGEVDQALDVVRREPVTPASLARAWTPPEEALGPEASKFVQTYPEKLGEALSNAPGAMYDVVKYPGQVLYGEKPYDPEEAVKWAVDAAGMAQTGGIGGAAAKAGETVLGSGPIRAYHGSPHQFERFDMSKIGTGEGAQGFGHGLYFAEHEPTARSYRDALSDTFVGGQPFSINDPLHQAASILHGDALGNRAKAVSIVENKLNRDFDPFNEHVLRILQTKKDIPAPVATGHMYDVNIHADPEKLINWNTPLAQQPKAVQELAHEADLSHLKEGNRTRSLIERFRSGQEQPEYLATGQTLHNALSDYGLKSNPELSQYLLDRGHPGIKYLDALSRGVTANPTHNYVIFNDKLIDINRRYADGGEVDPASVEDRALMLISRQA